MFMYGQTCYKWGPTTFIYLIHDIVCKKMIDVYMTIHNWLDMVAHTHDD